MKKILALMLVFVLALAFVACTNEAPAETPDTDTPVEGTEAPVEGEEAPAEGTEAPVEGEEAPAEGTEAPVEGEEAPAEEKVMTYAEFAAAELETPVTVETYVQAKQAWWENKATLYTQAEDGAYFIYEMPCTEEEYAQLVPGTKIKVSGIKAAWSGEVEIIEAKFEILEGSYIAEPMDATALLGTEELINHQNKLVCFKGMTVEAIEYKNGEPGDDIYVTLAKDGATYNFCVEAYFTDKDSEVYTAVSALEIGATIDVEAFLYWYEGANPHITSVAVAA